VDNTGVKGGLVTNRTEEDALCVDGDNVRLKLLLCHSLEEIKKNERRGKMAKKRLKNGKNELL
jgi:hypothetical protein